MPLRNNESATSATITDASFIAFFDNQSRAALSTRSARAWATNSMMMARASGSSDTTEKKTQSTTYCAALGLVSEMSFSATGMNAPGFASTAPAPMMAMTGDEATLLI